MGNKTVDKRDLVINQGEEILLNKLKDHIENEFCNYVYLELTLGEGIEDYYINCIKNEMLTVNGAFKIKKLKKDGKKVHHSMDDLLNLLIYFLSISLGKRALANRAKEIVEKYGSTVYLEGMEYYLKETLLGIKSDYFDKLRNDFEKMIEEYILS